MSSGSSNLSAAEKAKIQEEYIGKKVDARQSTLDEEFAKAQEGEIAVFEKARKAA
jgi:hypothetical protein